MSLHTEHSPGPTRTDADAPTSKRMSALLLACLSIFVVACGPSGGSDPAGAGAGAGDAFAVEAVVLGVGFDEPVTVEESSGSAAAADTAELTLDPNGESTRFARTLRATDNAGNTTHVRVDVTIGEVIEDD